MSVSNPISRKLTEISPQFHRIMIFKHNLNLKNATSQKIIYRFIFNQFCLKISQKNQEYHNNESQK